jgi:hypothetical protein
MWLPGWAATCHAHSAQHIAHIITQAQQHKAQPADSRPTNNQEAAKKQLIVHSLFIFIIIIVTVTKSYSVYIKYYSKQGEKIMVSIIVYY